MSPRRNLEYDLPGLYNWEMLKSRQIRRLLETNSPYSPDGTSGRQVIVRNLTVLFRLLRLFDDVKTIASLFCAHRNEVARFTIQLTALWKSLVQGRETYLKERQDDPWKDQEGPPLMKLYPVQTADEKRLLILIDKFRTDGMDHGEGVQAKRESDAIVRDWTQAFAADPQDLVDTGLPRYCDGDDKPEVDDADTVIVDDDNEPPSQEELFARALAGVYDEALEMGATRLKRNITKWLASVEDTDAGAAYLAATGRLDPKRAVNSPAGAKAVKQARAGNSHAGQGNNRGGRQRGHRGGHRNNKV
ncbi:hypothetical protein OQA88_5757 [Cercophora sp. LCS_1]